MTWHARTRETPHAPFLLFLLASVTGVEGRGDDRGGAGPADGASSCPELREPQGCSEC